jgi:colanic acid/amylovoran biosynthesis glycosyltransferase
MGGDPVAAPRTALLFTRFPVATETFLQREVEALRLAGDAPLVLAMWPSPDPPRSSALSADHGFHPVHLLSLFWWIPYWSVRAPRAMKQLARTLIEARRPNLTNVLETLLGMGYAVCRARALEGRVAHLHAMWASAPATAAWALSRLTGIPYSMAGHAYDLFENGGDGLLDVKIPEACFIRTSTEVGRTRWVRHGANPDRVHVIRRGLPTLPEFGPKPHPRPPYRLLAVGRMVEKMGFPFLLEILKALDEANIPFSAMLVGAGPLRRSIEERCARLGLERKVTFAGALSYPEVEGQLRAADLLVFSGQIARSGDRAGFPNIIGEAMAWGVPVCATPVGAVLEGIRDGESGLIATRPAEAALRIQKLFADPEAYQSIRKAGRQWVEAEFDAVENMRRFSALLAKARRQIPSATPGS